MKTYAKGERKIEKIASVVILSAALGMTMIYRYCMARF